MSCWGCESAKAHPTSGYFVADCEECSARHLAQSPWYDDSARAGTMTPGYRDALQAVFGVRWVQGHERVKAYAERLKC